MILDHLDNVSLYRGLAPRVVRALAALGDAALLQRAPGRYELEGSELFVLLQEYTTKARDQGRWESHRKYMDVQYVVEGSEVIGWARCQTQRVVEPYDAAKDIMFYEGEGSFFRVDQGMYAMFFPDDAHMPTLAVDKPRPVRKAVFKVLLD